MQNKPLIMQACETLGVPPDVKITDLRALVDLKLKILPEGSKEANLTKMAYDLLSQRTPEARRYEYDRAAFEWAKETARGEIEQSGPQPQTAAPVVSKSVTAPAPAQPASPAAQKSVKEMSGREQYELGKAQLRELVKRDGKNAPAWAIALSR